VEPKPVIDGGEDVVQQAGLGAHDMAGRHHFVTLAARRGAVGSGTSV
jgi:hypothetical protein